MKSIVTLSLLLFGSLTAHASTYSCAFVDEDFQEFGVEINMKAKKAALWDTEDWIVVPLVKGISASSALVIFSGTDSFGDAILIQFDASEGMEFEHRAIFPGVPTPGQEMTCRYLAADELLSGI